LQTDWTDSILIIFCLTQKLAAMLTNNFRKMQKHKSKTQKIAADVNTGIGCNHYHDLSLDSPSLFSGIFSGNVRQSHIVTMK